ncbi:unnamed protein product [Lactuca virosa]|uniref:Uncharacterized protein n=1 Tax=Lactuca virosa TaxID=75947 RepID=A0AAU9N7L0_9ASTR|nr:unnamed protein product [Lactuca virosa]
MEKVVSIENVVRSESDVLLESSERVEVGGEHGSVKEGFYLLRFGHVESSAIGSGEESPEFGYGENKFRDACIAASKALGVQDARELVDGVGKLEEAPKDGIDHGTMVDEALDGFASLDYIYVLGLEGLGVEKLKHMVQARGDTRPS